jgi:hypothetical protein
MQHSSLRIQQLVCFAVTITFLVTNAFTQEWQPLDGPWRANNVRQIAAGYDNTNTLVMYAANNGSHLVKYNDATEVWEHITQISSPNVVACKNGAPNIVVANDGSIIKYSTNSGNGWDISGGEFPSSLNPLSLYFAPGTRSHTDEVWLGTKEIAGFSSLWRSHNGGANFGAIEAFKNQYQTNITSILFHPTNDNIYFVGGSQIDAEGKFVEEDTTISLETEATTRGFWYSLDGGDTWPPEQSSMEEKNVTALAFSKNLSNVGMVLLGRHGDNSNSGKIFYAIDGDWNHWQLALFGVKRVYDIQVSPIDNHIVYASTNEGVFYSTDGGVNFTRKNDGLFDYEVKTLAIAALNNETRIFSGSSSSISEYNNVFYEWTDISREIDKVSVNTFFVYYDDILTGSSTFGGMSKYVVYVGYSEWNNYRVSDRGAFYANDINEDGYSVGTEVKASAPNPPISAIFDVYDPGERLWGNNQTGDQMLRCITTDDDFNIYAGGKYTVSIGGTQATYNLVYKYDDNEYWYNKRIGNTPVKSVLSLSYNSVLGKIYAGLDEEGIWTSPGVGEPWTQEPLGDRRINAFAVHEGGTMYSGGSTSPDNIFMWKYTEENGWQAIGNMHNLVNHILFHPSYADVNHLWVVVNNGYAILKTTNGGDSWEQIDMGTLPLPITDIQSDKFDYSNIYVSNAQGVWKIDPKPEKVELAVVNGQEENSEGNPINEITYEEFTQEEEEALFTTEIIELEENKFPKFRWEEALEKDLPDQRYIIYKRSSNLSRYRSYRSTDVTQFVDFSERITTGRDFFVYYYVRVIDDGGNLSDVSNILRFKVKDRAEPDKNIVTANTTLPEDFSLSQNHPNPFNPVTEIKYALPVDAIVSLKVLDILGKEVATLVNETKVAGYYTASFDANKLSSGLYFYRLTATGEEKAFTEVRKMILMK